MNKDWTASQEAVPSQNTKLLVPQGLISPRYVDFGVPRFFTSPSYHLQVVVFFKMCKETPMGESWDEALGRPGVSVEKSGRT